MVKSKFNKKLAAIVGCICAISLVVTSTDSVYATEIPTEGVSEASSEGATEEVTEATTENVTEEVTEPSTESATEEVTEATTEGVTEEATEAVTEPSAESTTEGMTEGTTAETTVDATTAASETTAQNPTDVTTAVPTETTTAVPAETTVAPTQSVTQPTTVAPTQAATQAPTQAVLTPITIDAISIDGDVSEWKAMNSMPVGDGSVSEWKVTKSSNGSMLYLCFSGIASTEWDTSYIWKFLTISYENGTSYTSQFANLDSSWINPGAAVATCSNASGTNPGLYAVECALPITKNGYTITFAGTTISESDIPEFVAAEKVEPVYNGIIIDGSYDDWDAVARTDADCPPEAGHSYDCLNAAACVFDGDYVYIYLQDGDSGSAAGAGVSSNGRYSITTDMGRQITFQLSTQNGGTVNGVSGAGAAYFGDEWEIAIPASALPVYKESISFGLYQSEPFVSGVMNLQGGSGTGSESGTTGGTGTGTAGEFTGIVYDGLYGDWSAYPHALIQYATSGTQTNNPDGEGALYADGSILYGHVISSMDAHIAQKGGEFAGAISICFNGEREYNGDKTWNLYPKLVGVSADGTINWNPATKDLESGTYEFYIADIRGEYNTQTQTNISQLGEYEQFLGRMTVSVSENNDEMEFYVDLEQAAKFLSHYSDTTVESSDFKLIEAQFGQIGSDYLATAGTSSGPYVGVALCMAVAGVVLLKRRRNKVVE